ncbi:Uncharacterised protein [Vibrio cholerae]|nr:Uncharacterised protein [Vibrio cholerae]
MGRTPATERPLNRALLLPCIRENRQRVGITRSR